MLRLLLILACLIGVAACTGPQATEAPGTVSEDDPPPLDTATLRDALHHQVNEARQRHGRDALAYDRTFERLASSHSQDMAANGYFSHTSRQDEDVNDRASRLELSPCSHRLNERAEAKGFGENLFKTTRYASYRDIHLEKGDESKHVARQYEWKSAATLAQETIEAWMESPGHRATLPRPFFEAHGLGIATTNDGLRVYITQNLC